MSTIYALSTAPFRSAIAVIRVSGPKAYQVVERLTWPNCRIVPREAALRTLRHPDNGDKLDRCLTIFTPAPKTFTGEDTTELYLHGSTAVIKAVLDALPRCASNIRQAEAGEFSKRAFYNGKMDLTQAEGLADLINAETDEQRRSAFRQSDGAISRACAQWREEIILLRSQLEAVIDFGEDNDSVEVNISKSVVSRAALFKEQLADHLNSSIKGELLRSGIRTVIFGPPNAGKSSLLNILAQKDVSIVSGEAGTTRDIVESMCDVAGFPVIFSDTAGLRSTTTTGQIEQEGIRRAKQRIDDADLRICVIPYTDSIDKLILQTLETYIHKGTLSESVLLVINKSDQGNDDHKLKRMLTTKLKIDGDQVCLISCTTGSGLDEFANILSKRLRLLTSTSTMDGNLGMNTRQRDQLRKCQAHLEQAIELGESDIVLAAEELRYAADSLGRLTGRIDVEEVLASIFSTFCIGK